MNKFVFLVLVGLLTSGCATRFVPPVDNVALPKTAKVGVFIDVGEHPTHTHIGTTIFNNHVKRYPYDWQLKQSLFDKIKTQIELQTGLEVVALNAPLVSDFAELDFVSVREKQWSYIERRTALRETLAEQGIQAIIALRETRTLAELNCSQYGCAEFYSEGVGLFTRSFFGMDRYYASSSFEISAEILNPAIDLGMLDALWDMTIYSGKNVLLDGFSDPADFKNITEQEMLPVKAGVMDYIHKLTSQIAQYLNGDMQSAKKN